MAFFQKMIQLLTTTPSECVYLDACEDRSELSDRDFHQRFYAASNVSPQACSGVRRVLCEQLNMCNTLPNDNVAIVFDDVDIAEVCFEIGEEFDVTFSDELCQQIDGTVDALIHATQHLLDAGQQHK